MIHLDTGMDTCTTMLGITRKDLSKKHGGWASALIFLGLSLLITCGGCMNKLFSKDTYKILDIVGLGKYVRAELWYPCPPMSIIDKPVLITLRVGQARGYLYYE